MGEADNIIGDIRIVSAGAGTGKTHQLTEEVFKALDKGEIDHPDKLLLTTFTKKAAAELKSRVSERLFASNKRDESHLLAQSVMGTVNSVCGQLLSDYAFECGLQPVQRVIDEGPAKAAFEKALDTALNPEEYEKIDHLAWRFQLKEWPEQVSLIAAKARTYRLEKEQLIKCAENSANRFLDALGKSKDGLQKLIQDLEAAVPTGERLLGAVESTLKPEKLASARAGLRHIKRAYSKIKAGRFQWQDIHNLKDAGIKNLGKHKAEMDGALEEVRKAGETHFQWPSFQDEYRKYITMMFGAAAEAIEGYENHKRERGLIDFTDQECLCLDRLSDGKLADALKGRIGLMMVDEFQDTNPIQLSVFLKLSRIAKRSVWVGDPKQAIYGFRDSDPQIMAEAVRQIQGNKPQAETDTLSVCRRSRRPLVDFFNGTFEKEMNKQGLSVGLKHKRDDDPGMEPLHSWVVDKGEAKANQKQDLYAIAAGIASVLKASGKYKVVDPRTGKPRDIRKADIAVLARRNKTCQAAAAALREAGIPAEIAVAGLLEEEHIRFVIAALRLFANKSDKLAQAIISFMDEVGFKGVEQEQWLADRVAASRKAGKKDEKDASGEMNPVIKKVLAAAERAEKLPLEEAVKLAIEATDAWRMPTGAGQIQRSADFEQFLKYVRLYAESAMQESKGATILGLMDYLEELQEDLLDENQPAGGDVVRVTTWHSAKGLEWPMVILCDLDWSMDCVKQAWGLHSGFNKAVNLANPLEGREILFWPRPYNPTETYFLAEMDAMRTKIKDNMGVLKELEDRNNKEDLRLLYVAFTRARDYLVFCAKPGETSALAKALPDFKLPQDAAGNANPLWKVQVFPGTAPTAGISAGKEPWLTYTETKTPRKPLFTIPSSLETETIAATEAEADEPEMFVKAVKIDVPDEKKEKVGSAIHEYMRVDFTAKGAASKKEIAERILKSYEMDGVVKAEEVVQQADSFIAHAEKKWKPVKWMREWPLMIAIKDRIIRGIADLVLETKDGYVIVDYKTYSGPDPVKKALKYAGQLAAYSKAMETASEKGKVIETWICFPVLGTMVKVTLKNRERLINQAMEAAG